MSKNQKNQAERSWKGDAAGSGLVSVSEMNQSLKLIQSKFCWTWFLIIQFHAGATQKKYSQVLNIKKLCWIHNKINTTQKYTSDEFPHVWFHQWGSTGTKSINSLGYCRFLQDMFCVFTTQKLFRRLKLDGRRGAINLGLLKLNPDTLVHPDKVGLHTHNTEPGQ